jgi:hypothetical protein
VLFGDKQLLNTLLFSVLCLPANARNSRLPHITHFGCHAVQPASLFFRLNFLKKGYILQTILNFITINAGTTTSLPLVLGLLNMSYSNTLDQKRYRSNLRMFCTFKPNKMLKVIIQRLTIGTLIRLGRKR